MKLRAKTFSGAIERVLLGLMIVAIMLTTGTRSYTSAPEADLTPATMDFDVSEMGNACLVPVTIPGQGVKLVSNDAVGGNIRPVRSIVDPYPSFIGIAVDAVNNRVVMSDANRKSVLIYDRAEGSRSAKTTKPLRQISGQATLLGFVAGVAVDPVVRELYTVNADVEDNMAVFSYDAEGNVKPARALAVPHQAWGVALSPSRDEVAISVQGANLLIFYHREAKGFEAPVRSIMGTQTGLADPHGLSWDGVNQEIVVANQGNVGGGLGVALTSSFGKSSAAADGPEETSAGRIEAPSITVYPATGKGNIKPLHTIQGSRTQLNLPMGTAVDADRNEIAVVNNGDNSLLIFRRTDSGNVAPVRVIRGPRTGIERPMGVAIDAKNNELWVTNFGNHSAVVFDRAASGNVTPKRIIRNAPAGTPTPGFGNPDALTFDTKRQQLLVAS